jgi:hypothetical protein
LAAAISSKWTIGLAAIKGVNQVYDAWTHHGTQ